MSMKKDAFAVQYLIYAKLKFQLDNSSAIKARPILYCPRDQGAIRSAAIHALFI